MNARRSSLTDPALPSGRKLVWELFGLLLLFWAAFLLLALFSYSPQDPSINHVVSNVGEIQNSGGMFGAYISGLLVDLFGCAAFIWPLAFLAWGSGCVSTWVDMPWWRWGGFLLLGGCFITLGTASGIGIRHVRGGGMLGLAMSDYAVSLTGTGGAGLLWLFTFFLALELCFGIRWFALLNVLWRRVNIWCAEHEMLPAMLLSRTLARWKARRNGAETGPVIPLLDVDEDDESSLFAHHANVASRAAGKRPEPAWMPPLDDTPEAPSGGTLASSEGATAKQPDGLLGRLVRLRLPSGLRLPVLGNLFPSQRSASGPLLELNVPVSLQPRGVGKLAALLRGAFRHAPSPKADMPLPGVTPEDARKAPAHVPFAIKEGKAPLEPLLLRQVEEESSLVDGSLSAEPSPFMPEPVFPDASDAKKSSRPGGAGPVLMRSQVPPASSPLLDDPFAPRPAPAPREEARASAMPSVPEKPLSLPPLSLLAPAGKSDTLPSRELMRSKGEQLMACLANFNISAELVRVTPGPVVTLFELRPAPGIKVARIRGLKEDIKLSLRAIAVRIETIPGEDTIGVEIPNEERATVNFRSILESQVFASSRSLLTLGMGVGIDGAPVVAELSKMPHLLVGGATGSGKSVGVNAFLLSLLYKATPDELKLLLIDPKRVEFALYADLPHLIHPVVNEPAIAKNALDWAVHEMEQRYSLLQRAGVRKFADYNEKVRTMGKNPPSELAGLKPMPYLVIVVDELADLMMSAGKEVEAHIVRLAQLARAAGIHLIIATQRPSVDVVTGLIKANFPSRVAFLVSNSHDSRTILDESGAEDLLGMGDMLFRPNGGKPRRLHGPFVPDADVAAVVKYWKAQRRPNYEVDFEEWGAPVAETRKGESDVSGLSDEDAMYNEIVQFAMEQGKSLSISKLQRQFRIGFNKAARFMEQMQQDGIIAPPGHANRARDVIADK